MNKVKVAVIGLGGMSQLVHLPILSKLKDVDIVAVAEKNKSRLNAVAEKFNISNKYQDYKNMLEQVSFDALLIITPTYTHVDITLDAVKHCKNIFIEKPIALSLSETKKINKAAEDHEAKIMVGMNHRFRPDSLLLKSLITTDEIGKPFYIKSNWIKNRSTKENWAVNKNEAGGGVLMDLGIVLLDLTLWFINYPDIISVSSQHYSHTTKEVEDTSLNLIRCENNISFSMEVSWSLKCNSDKLNLSIFGDKGFASLMPLQAMKKIEDNYIDYSPASYASDKNLIKRSYENQLKHFIGSVKGTHSLISTSLEAEHRMKVIDAMYNSATQNREILL